MHYNSTLSLSLYSDRETHKHMISIEVYLWRCGSCAHHWRLRASEERELTGELLYIAARVRARGDEREEQLDPLIPVHYQTK